MTGADTKVMPETAEGADSDWQSEPVQAVAAQGLGSYRFALLFVALYYIRPQDWIPGLEGFNIIRPIMFGWGLVILMQGGRTLADWFRSPHDWAVTALYAFVVWYAPDEVNARSAMFPVVVFYFLTLHALSQWQYLLGYIKCWNICLLTVASFGVLQSLGLDITNGRDYTDAMAGRLAIGTWLANNPNALGHTVVVAIPLSYLLFFWRGSAFGRMFIFPACLGVAGWCAWLTESKGSFLVGGGLLALIFVIGRPKWIQIFTVLSVLTFGVGALSFLPRMEQMGNLRSDEGVMGRLMAWEQAKVAMESSSSGVGWRQFMALIEWQYEGGPVEEVSISTHSSYVQVGADLGRNGMFLWLLCLCIAMRTLITFKAETEEQERCRRCGLILLIAYMVSGWMINRQYHTEYYLLIAVAAAIHRLAAAKATQPQEMADDTASLETSEAQEAGAEQTNPKAMSETGEPQEAGEVSSVEKARKAFSRWKWPDWKDLTISAGATWLVVWVWDWLLLNL